MNIILCYLGAFFFILGVFLEIDKKYECPKDYKVITISNEACEGKKVFYGKAPSINGVSIATNTDGTTCEMFYLIKSGDGK